MSDTALFEPFSKIPRLSREITITEKIDGTNAQIFIEEVGTEVNLEDAIDIITTDSGIRYSIRAGSRNRWLTIANDNYGFARWVLENAVQLARLGPGRHFGEWWGAGIQRRYNQTEKIFSLFNVARWCPAEYAVGTRFEESGMCVPPACCRVVPVLYRGTFDSREIEYTVASLAAGGSKAAPGFMDPEGIVVWHSASRTLFKKTIKNDESPKGKVNE